MRPVLDAWAQMIAAARGAGVPVIYTTPVSRADGADVVMLVGGAIAMAFVNPEREAKRRSRRLQPLTASI